MEIMKFPSLADEAEMDRLALEAAAASTPTVLSANSSSTTAKTIRIFVVRHGERADETSKIQRQMRQKSAENKAQQPIHRADSLLTATGLQQAQLCAKVLRQRIGENAVVLYCSPLCRCAQTASPIAAEFQTPVQPVASLGQCALAIRRAGLIKAVSSVYQPSDALERICDGEAVFVERIDDIELNFLQGVEFLCREELMRVVGKRREIIIVAHREAFYGDLFKRTGEVLPYKPPYCCIGEFIVSLLQPVIEEEDEDEDEEKEEKDTSFTPTPTSAKGGKGDAKKPKLTKAERRVLQEKQGGALRWDLVTFDVGYTTKTVKPPPSTGPTSGYPRASNRSFDGVGQAAMAALM
jgi:broad specificity phosphatase PhoE